MLCCGREAERSLSPSSRLALAGRMYFYLSLSDAKLIDASVSFVTLVFGSET